MWSRLGAGYCDDCAPCTTFTYFIIAQHVDRHFILIQLPSSRLLDQGPVSIIAILSHTLKQHWCCLSLHIILNFHLVVVYLYDWRVFLGSVFSMKVQLPGNGSVSLIFHLSEYWLWSAGFSFRRWEVKASALDRVKHENHSTGRQNSSEIAYVNSKWGFRPYGNDVFRD